MRVGDLLALCEERGVSLRMKDDELCVTGAERLSSVHRSIMRRHTPKIVRILRENEAIRRALLWE